MNARKLIDDRSAVSPVIGVILMVAVTVILAAIIGTFVLGLGTQVEETAPNVMIDFDQSGSGADASVTITHDGGEPLEKGTIFVDVEGDKQAVDGSDDIAADDWTADDEISAGDSITLDGQGDGSVRVDGSEIWDSSTGYGSGTTVRVIWESDVGDTSNVVASHEVD